MLCSPLGSSILPRRLQCIPIHASPVHQPQRVGLDVAPSSGIILPHPVLVQAAFKLGPLAGEAKANRNARGGITPLTGKSVASHTLAPMLFVTNTGRPAAL